MTPYLRDARCEAARRALDRTAMDAGIKERLGRLLAERKGGHAVFEESPTRLCVIALSGGADSTAALMLARRCGLAPLAVTVVPHAHVMTPDVKGAIVNLCRKVGAPHEFLECEEESFPLVEGARAGRYHPCGRCHALVTRRVFAYAREKGVPAVVFGDLLSCGSESVKIKDGVLRINLPAMLSMDKEETRRMAGRGEESFGCALLREVHETFPRMRRPSIARIFRETRAGVLSWKQAVAYLESVMSCSE